jgi:hypothetical protein
MCYGGSVWRSTFFYGTTETYQVKSLPPIPRWGLRTANTMLTLNRWLLNREIETNMYSGQIYTIVNKTKHCYVSVV